MKIILASQSQFRKHALDILGLEYETVPSNFDESTIRHDDPYALAKALAEAKAMVIGGEHANSVIIAADLFVVCAGQIYEKPKDEAQAVEMLKSLSGKSFETITGLAVYNSKTEKMLSTTEACTVKFRELSDFEITDYVKRFPVLKCAAAFEGDGMLRFAEHIQGCYTFKAGIPVNKLIEFLRENDVKV
ncbi:MAG: Maf family protein [Candidatus Nanoarchaeia archaeon]